MKPRTRLDYHRRIASVIEAILAEPGGDHSLQSLAGTACMSAFHFHRVYRAMTGESVADTLNRVRMAQAARRLGETREPVTDVAFDAGYESPQAFSRAFRQFAGVSPSAFRDRFGELASHTEAPEPANIALVDLPAIRLLALRHVGPMETIGQSWRKLGALARAICPDAMPERVGMAVGDPEGGDSFVYWACLVADHAMPDHPELMPVTVAGGRYASYRLTGSYGLITQAYRGLFGGWLPRSGYDCDDRPTLEFYRSPWAHGDRANCVTDVMIPIKEP